MTVTARIVFDTNLLVSRLVLPQSTCAKALGRAESNARLLISEATMYELADVLSRPKFDGYVSLEDRKGFIERPRMATRRAEPWSRLHSGHGRQN